MAKYLARPATYDPKSRRMSETNSDPWLPVRCLGCNIILPFEAAQQGLHICLTLTEET